MDNMQLWLSSSTDSINLNDSAEGFYLNPDLEGLTGLPEIRSINGLNAGYDGGWTATQLWAARLITIRGVIALNDKAAVETKRKALAKLMAQGKNESLQLKFVSESGNVYTTSVRTTYCTMALKRVFWRQEYQIQLRADDPLIYDDGGAELVAILRVMAGVNGFEIPFEIPFAIGDSADPTDVNVGDEATYPLITLKGDLHSPTIVNLTTNQQMQVLADIITHVEWKAYTTAQTIDGYLKIQDGLQDAPLTLSTLQGNATQKTLSGKNICYTSDVQSATIFRCSCYIKDISGTTLTMSAITNMAPLSATIYTFVDGVDLHTSVGTFNQASAGVRGYGIADLSSITTQMQGGTVLTLAAYRSGGSLSTITDAQIENGSSMTSYEPYCGGIPSPNPSYPQTVNVVSGEQTVKITGKNLIKLDDIELTNQSVNYYREPSITERPVLEAGKTYTFSADLGIGGSVSECRLSIGCGTNSYALDIYTDSSVQSGRYTATFTPTATQLASGANFFMRFPRFTTGTVSGVNYSIKNAMLEESDHATAYEPYQAQSQEINLGGSNIFDISSAIMANIYMNTNGWTSASNDWIGTDSYIEVEPNTTYTLSSSATAGTQVAINQYTSQIRSSFISPRIDTATFTTSATAKYISFSIKDPNATNIMLNKGSTAQPYVPYTTYTYELAKIGNYTDGFRIIDGTWYIHEAVGKFTLDGTQSSSSYIARTNTFRAIFQSGITGLGSGSADNRLSKSERFTNDTGIWGNDREGFYVDNANVVVSANISTVGSTIASMKAWFASNPTKFYTPLATPTDTEITDSELIAQLNHIYELYQGTNNLWLIPNAGAQGEMGVSYATDKDVDYHEVVIDCQARTVTQDGQNLYPALAPGSEFIRLVPGQNRLYLTSTVSSDDGTAEVKFKKGNISI